MSEYKETKKIIPLHHGINSHELLHKSNIKLYIALPVAVVSMAIVLLLPTCQQSPQQLTTQSLNSSLKDLSHILERQKESDL